MTRDADIPLMVLDDRSALGHVGAGSLVVKVLHPGQAEVHAEVAAAAFQAPVEHFRQLITPSVIGRPGVCCYIGELDGHSVATAVSVRLGEHVGIFNVATLPANQRRGYGAAITARAVRDGLGDGAQWAWLQSSPAGHRVYERLGFTTLESWEFWIAGG